MAGLLVASGVLYATFCLTAFLFDPLFFFSGSPPGRGYLRLRQPAGPCSQAAREQLTQRHL